MTSLQVLLFSPLHLEGNRDVPKARQYYDGVEMCVKGDCVRNEESERERLRYSAFQSIPLVFPS